MILFVENEEIMDRITNNSYLVDCYAMENSNHWTAARAAIHFC